MPDPDAQAPIQARHAGGGAARRARALDRGNPLPFLVFFAAYWALVLWADAQGGGVGSQRLLGLSTWLFLALGLWRAPCGWRTRTVMLVVVATLVECACSLGWGLYQYRYHNVPLFVPPGHGLFYLAAGHLSRVGLLRRQQGALVVLAALASGAWVLRGLLLAAHPDIVGALCWLLLLLFLWRGRDPLLFSVTFGLTMGLELYGTHLGAWQWLAQVPGLGWSAGNPPAGIGAMYCVLDALAWRLALHMQSVRRRFSGDSVTGCPPARAALEGIHASRRDGRAPNAHGLSYQERPQHHRSRVVSDREAGEPLTAAREGADAQQRLSFRHHLACSGGDP